MPIPRIRTGVGPIDIAFNGGLPLGNSTLIWGPPKSGKSTLAANIMATFQRDHPDLAIIYIETEDKYDPEFLASVGVDIGRLVVRDDIFYIHEILDFIREAISEIEKYPEVGLIVLDSLGLLVAERRIEKSVGDLMIPPETNIISGAMGQFNTAQLRRRRKGKPLTLIMTTHQLIRPPTSPKGHAVPVPAGGNRLQFDTCGRIRLQRIEQQKKFTMNGIDVFPLAEVEFIVNANKGGGHRSGSFRFFQTNNHPFRIGQVDQLDHWWLFGRECGYIGGAGTSWRLGEREDRFKGKVEIFDFWREHLDIYEEDQKKMLPLAVEWFNKAIETRKGTNDAKGTIDIGE